MKNHDQEDSKFVELPEPTAWPIIAAFALTLLFAGLVTSLFVTLIGVIVALIGFAGWFFDVFPHPRHVSVPIEEAPHPQTTARSIQFLKVGQRGHRMHLPVEVPPLISGIKGGIVGAIAMAILACSWGFFKYHSIWYPVNLLAAAAVPDLADATQAALSQFHLMGFIVALISHGAVSIMIGLLYIVLLPMLPAKFEWFWGGIMTPLIWSGFLFATIRFVNPALAVHVDWPWFIVCQVAFGMVCGYVVFKEEKVETMQSLSLAAKLGIEAQEENP
ncbi:MAG: hypothetical protein WCG66_12025 [bacterium]